MKILLAYDGFEHSSHAVEEAAELATGGRGKVTVMSVVSEREARATKSGGHRFLAPHAHQDVAVAHDRLLERGVDSEMKIAHGEAVEEVIREAEAGGYALIVVGSRGLGPVGRLLLGSVSEKLVREAPCPVLVAGKDVTERHEPGETS
jgi:nucleotide-binding universal stress UspA family protein